MKDNPTRVRTLQTIEKKSPARSFVRAAAKRLRSETMKNAEDSLARYFSSGMAEAYRSCPYPKLHAHR